MKRSMALKPVIATVLLVLTTLAAVVTRAVQAAEVNDNIQNYLQLMRSDLNATKVALVSKIIKLSEEDAKNFWPLYRDYENELGKLAIDRADLIAEFVTTHQNATFDNTKAKDVAKRWLKGQRARLDLLEKYHGKIEEALTPIQAAQFLQIENQIGLFIDLAIASEMPAVGSQPK